MEIELQQPARTYLKSQPEYLVKIILALQQNKIERNFEKFFHQ